MCDLISDFLEDLARSDTPLNTQKALGGDLRTLLRWYDATHHGRTFRLEDLTTADIRAWMKAGNGKPAAPATANRRKNSLRRLVVWAMDRGALSADPTRDIKDLPLGDRAPRSVSADAINRLLHAAAQRPDPEAAARDVAILSTLAYTGLRVEELCALAIFDVNLVVGSVRVRRGKGNKPRTVPLHDDAIAPLRRYLDLVRPGAAGDEWLWVHRVGVGREWTPGITQHSVQRLVRELAEVEAERLRADAQLARRSTARDALERLAQELDRITPHALRHAFVRRLIEAGVEIPAIQKAVGHASLRSTEVYLQPHEESVRQAIAVGAGLG